MKLHISSLPIEPSTTYTNSCITVSDKVYLIVYKLYEIVNSIGRPMVISGTPCFSTNKIDQK